MKRKISLTSATICVSITSLTQFAQAFPDSGQVIQELKTPITLPDTKEYPLVIDEPLKKSAISGGNKVQLESIQISGNSIFDKKELIGVLGDFKGKDYDMAELMELTQRLTNYYKAKDYPFARALIPAQKIDKGHLKIKIIEGRYGKITMGSKHGASKEKIRQGQRFLNTLQSNDLIKASPLERVTLILENQPGYSILPIIRPGEKLGLGDLNVELIPSKKYGGTVSFDNYGDRHTGRHRGALDLYLNSPFLFGDQITFSSIYTNENLWLGSSNYNLPLGASGLRGQIGYSQTYYQIAQEFSDLDAKGMAKIASGSLSYPIIRSQKANLLASVGYQHKWLNDRLVGRDNNKKSYLFPIGLNFDVRDQFLGGGVTYGSVSWSHGFLNLDNQLNNIDKITAKSSGAFDKVNMDISRLQSISENSLFFGRFLGQWARKNLDSSERFGLGGINGVRAYPMGEGFGDEGWITQLELRYKFTSLTPYAFYDYGNVRINHDPWEITSNNHRGIGGTGIGVRSDYKGIKTDFTLAWLTKGGKPGSDPAIKNNPIVWLKLSYSF